MTWNEKEKKTQSPVELFKDVEEQQILIMDDQSTNLQQLHDAIMSICSKVSIESFQHLVESKI